MTKATSIQDTVIIDAAKTKTGWRIKVYWFAGIFTAFVFALAIIAGWHVIVTIAPYLLTALGLAIFGLIVFGFYELIQISRTRHKTYNAKRRIIEAEATQKEAEARAAEFFTYSRSAGVIRHSANSMNVLALPMAETMPQALLGG